MQNAETMIYFHVVQVSAKGLPMSNIGQRCKYYHLVLDQMYNRSIAWTFDDKDRMVMNLLLELHRIQSMLQTHLALFVDVYVLVPK